MEMPDEYWNSPREVRMFWGLDEVAKKKAKARFEELEAQLHLDSDRYIDLEEERRARDSSRPLAEPPMFNYEIFGRLHVPSDDRCKLIFPDDIAERTAFKDTEIEDRLLEKYVMWAQAQCWNTETKRDNEFFKALTEGVRVDVKAVNAELEDLRTRPEATYLKQWEYTYLDNDGGTKGIEHNLLQHVIIWNPWDAGGRETWAKYGHLAPSNYPRELVPQPPGAPSVEQAETEGKVAMIVEGKQNMSTTKKRKWKWQLFPHLVTSFTLLIAAIAILIRLKTHIE